MSKRGTIWIGILAAFVLAAAAVHGQQPDQPKPPHRAPADKAPGPGLPSDWNDRDVKELVHAVMMARIARELNLTDEQTVIMMRRFGEHREAIEGIIADRNRAFKELKEAISTNAADDVLQKKLSAVVELDKKQAEMRQNAFKSVAEGMTPKQQAQLYVFIMDFENHMKRLIQRAKELGSERLMRLRDEGGDPAGFGPDRRPGERPRRIRGEAPDNGPPPQPLPNEALPPPPPPKGE
ncbi:MAG: hypothetical protein K1Y02_00030 [Candidatus Hydrogenedentes bacterium]|nr:hypothetical protein [Candidatus Hydrogenedentota bacterium]